MIVIAERGLKRRSSLTSPQKVALGLDGALELKATSLEIAERAPHLLHLGGQLALLLLEPVYASFLGNEHLPLAQDLHLKLQQLLEVLVGLGRVGLLDGVGQQLQVIGYAAQSLSRTRLDHSVSRGRCYQALEVHLPRRSGRCCAETGRA